jgi:glycosyltransferase involved in cell wall biosynthesis
MKPKRPLRVAVLIDHRPNHPAEVGGLAGTWEQISRAVAGREDLELTLFFLGDRPRILNRASNVRYVLLPPILGTERFFFLKGIPTHTDLAPFHPPLYRRLNGFDLIHTTDAFHAFARTALRYARNKRIPLTNSIQTDIIEWARIHTPDIVRRLCPNPTLARWFLEDLGFLDRQQRKMERRFARYLRQCRTVFVSHPRDFDRVRRLAPSIPIRFMRRGIDLSLFHPHRRDRRNLEQRFGIPPTRTLLLFVGRLDIVKGAHLAARVVRELAGMGLDVHLLCVGDGAQKEEIRRILGPLVTVTGNLPHEELGWIYASADLLLFPSEAEVWPNVVMEARACGLPVLGCRQGAGHVMEGSGVDGLLLPGRSPETWVRALTELLADPQGIKAMGERARRSAESQAWPWERVLEEEILPAWIDCCRETPPGL